MAILKENFLLANAASQIAGVHSPSPVIVKKPTNEMIIIGMANSSTASVHRDADGVWVKFKMAYDDSILMMCIASYAQDDLVVDEAQK